MSDDITKYIVKLSWEEYDERNTTDFEEIQAEYAREKALGATAKNDLLENRKRRTRELTTDRKRKQHKREKERDIASGVRDGDGLLKQKKKSRKVRHFVCWGYWSILLTIWQRELVEKHTSKTNSTRLPGAFLKAKAAGSKAQKICQRHARTNWFKPSTWNAIDSVAKACRFWTGEMISRLRAQAGGDKTYASLAAGTIAH